MNKAKDKQALVLTHKNISYQEILDYLRNNGDKIIIKVRHKQIVHVIIKKSMTIENINLRLSELINASPFQVITLQKSDEGDIILEIEESIASVSS